MTIGQAGWLGLLQASSGLAACSICGVRAGAGGGGYRLKDPSHRSGWKLALGIGRGFLPEKVFVICIRRFVRFFVTEYTTLIDELCR